MNSEGSGFRRGGFAMVAHTQRQELSLPSPKEIQFAENLGRELGLLCDAKDDNDIKIAFHYKSKNVKIPFPRKVLFLLVRILEQMAAGNAVTLIPIHAELTTQEAADLLNVSRPFIVKLLEDNKIRYHKVGTHRRIKLEDLMKYKTQMQVESEEAMNELTLLGQEIEETFNG
jgi:excisionase family DNA binding protein